MLYLGDADNGSCGLERRSKLPHRRRGREVGNAIKYAATFTMMYVCWIGGSISGEGVGGKY